MPILGARGKIKVVLETTSEIAGEEAWVELHSAILAEDLEDLSGMDPEKDKDYSYIFLSKVISDWNMTNPDGSKAEINVANLRKFPIDDLQSLEKNTNFNKQLDRLKKNNSSSTLPVKEETETLPSATSA